VSVRGLIIGFFLPGDPTIATSQVLMEAYLLGSTFMHRVDNSSRLPPLFSGGATSEIQVVSAPSTWSGIADLQLHRYEQIYTGWPEVPDGTDTLSGRYLPYSISCLTEGGSASQPWP